MKKRAFILVFFPLVLFAKTPVWEVVHEKSNIIFTAVQSHVPVSAEFKLFDAKIDFDRDKLDESEVSVTIDVNSVYAEYQDLVDTLKAPEWFDAKQFPTATFISKKFTFIKDDQYACEGDLTVRDKTHPVIITFNFLKYTDTEAELKGKTTLKRLDFGVGQGEWVSTDEVKDEVVVKILLKAVKK